jgi:hypothetical protein
MGRTDGAGVTVLSDEDKALLMFGAHSLACHYRCAKECRLSTDVCTCSVKLAWAEVERIASDAAQAAERALAERIEVLDKEQSALLPGSNAAIWSEVWSKHVRTALRPEAATTEGAVEPDAWVDRHGDVWRLGNDGLLWTEDTAPFPREHVEKKWGPLRPHADDAAAVHPDTEGER